MIDEFGTNLNVLLLVNIGQDWQAFSTWYSLYKNLPNVNCSLCYIQEKNNTPFQLFQWTKRLKIPAFGIFDKKDDLLNVLNALIKLNKKNVLVLPALSATLKPLNDDLLLLFNNETFLKHEKIYFSNLSQVELLQNLDDFMIKDMIPYQEVEISKEAKEYEETYPIITYYKGCGNWIYTRKGCPFASVEGLITNVMTINEQKLFQLWQKLVPLYNSVA